MRFSYAVWTYGRALVASDAGRESLRTAAARLCRELLVAPAATWEHHQNCAMRSSLRICDRQCEPEPATAAPSPPVYTGPMTAAEALQEWTDGRVSCNGSGRVPAPSAPSVEAPREVWLVMDPTDEHPASLAFPTHALAAENHAHNAGRDKLAGPYVLVQPTQSDEERARAWLTAMHDGEGACVADVMRLIASVRAESAPKVGGSAEAAHVWWSSRPWADGAAEASLAQLLAAVRAESAPKAEDPYCDVCGRSGSDLSTPEHANPVEVCRDCFDVARDPPPGESAPKVGGDIHTSSANAEAASEAYLNKHWHGDVRLGADLTSYRAAKADLAALITAREQAARAEGRAALETENARLMSELAGSKAQEKATDDMLSEELEERDARNDHVAETASMLGCEEEWSNLHDHYDCIRMAAMVDRSYRESVDEIDALRTENRALREALESIATRPDGDAHLDRGRK